MSAAVFPALPGLAWSIEKIPEFATTVRTAQSGQETRIANWSRPRWHFRLSYELLRADTAHQELQQLVGFYLARQGQYDSFLLDDVWTPDNAVAGQGIGTGDGSTTSFQLCRAFGGFVESVTAPRAVGAVYVNGAAVAVASVGAWGSATPGVVPLAAAPAAGAMVTADFSYYFPVRFAADTAEFSQFMNQLWELRRLELVTVF